MRPMAAFGLPDDADERAVKREYVKRLKTTRPDEDPAGFQELRACYERALAWVESYARPTDEPADGEIVNGIDYDDARRPYDAPPTIAPTPDFGHPGFDFATFYESVVTLGSSDDPARMRRLLQAQDALWSLEAKAHIAYHLIERLWEERPAMAPKAFDALASFFDEWRVDRGRDDHGVMALREVMTRRWFGFPDAPTPTPARSNTGGSSVPIWPIVMGMLALSHLIRACST